MSNEMLKARLCAPVGLNDCIGVSQLQLAAAHAAGVIDLQLDEIAALRTYASKGDEVIKSLDDQLATVKAEIAELVDTLDKLLDEACGLADQVHYEYGIGEKVYDESITNAEKLLAKHKESK